MDEIERIRDEIVALCKPYKIILYGRKHNVSTGSEQDINLCVVINDGDKETAEKLLYLAIDSDISFNVLLYTADEWNELLEDEQSYAHKIMKKGTVIYGQQVDRQARQ